MAQRSCAAPAVLLVILGVGFAGFVFSSAQVLPERVATHFGSQGYPNGWMSRPSAILMMASFGLGMPLFLTALSFAMRLFPTHCINIPNREYWLAPERRNATCAVVRCQMLWLSCLVLLFMAGLHWLTIVANSSTPVRLPTGPFLIILSAFLAGIAIWILFFVRQFKRPISGG